MWLLVRKEVLKKKNVRPCETLAKQQKRQQFSAVFCRVSNKNVRKKRRSKTPRRKSYKKVVDVVSFSPFFACSTNRHLFILCLYINLKLSKGFEEYV